jgi:hypothetical protein
VLRGGTKGGAVITLRGKNFGNLSPLNCAFLGWAALPVPVPLAVPEGVPEPVPLPLSVRELLLEGVAAALGLGTTAGGTLGAGGYAYYVVAVPDGDKPEASGPVP